jgi:hypothetical protein
MPGVTFTLTDLSNGSIRTVVTDESGNYRFDNIEWGSRVELVPTLTDYEFYPPAVIWEGIVEDEIWNFIAVGPPPPPPPPPANQPTLAWSSYFDNSPQLADYNAMLGRDAAGNIYTGGTSNVAENGNTDIVLFKTDPNGNRLWSRSFNGDGDYKDGLKDLAVDADGNIVLTGFSYRDDPANPALRSYDYVTLKYNADGDLIWSKYYGGNAGYDDFAQSLKTDAAGNVYIGGYSWGIGTYANYATVKYSPDGEQMWAKRYAGGNGDMLNEIELDSSGDVYVTGYSTSIIVGASEDIVTIKYNAAGTQQWLNRYNSPTNDDDEAFELEIDEAGNVLVLGETYDFDTTKTIIHKINGSTGASVWTRPLDFTGGNGEQTAIGIMFDHTGNIILTGMLYDFVSYNVDSFIAKLDPEAAVLWSKVYDGPSEEDYDGDPNVTADAADNLYVAITSEGFANADIQVIKYKPDGVEDWTYRFGNPFLGDDATLDWRFEGDQQTMLLNSQGHVYLAGESYIPGQSTDLVVFKLEPVAEMRAVPFDFDGDRKADISVYRPDTGYWYILKSSDGDWTAKNWGISSDRIVPADYDGDGRYDPAVYRGGIWFVWMSSTATPFVQPFGLPRDVPRPADFDNDGKADINVFRDGTWHSLSSFDGSYKAIPFGLSTDIPIPSDYDHNRRSDVAVYRSGTWYVRYQDGLPTASIQFGTGSDKLVPADYDGDKQADYAVFRQGIWYIWQSTTESTRTVQWGIEGDVPVPADYDGDKKADIAVYRGGVWYILQSSNGQYKVVQFGLPTDVPVPSAFVK